MTNTDTGAVAPKIFKIPLKAGATFEVKASDLNSFDEDTYAEILILGLKALLNRGMDKAVGPVKDLEGDKLAAAQAAAISNAQKNFTKLQSGDVKKTTAKSAKTSGVVNTEAMRLARTIIKDAIKLSGQKVSYIEASTITAMAKTYLGQHPELIEQAKASIEARNAEVSKTGTGLEDLVKAVPVSAKKKKAAEDAAAKKKAEAQLSAKQAGKTEKHKPAKTAPQATT